MHKTVPMVIGFILLILATWLPFLPIPVLKEWVTAIDNLAYDQQLKIRLLTESKVLAPIAIVDIDDQSLKEYGRWPWSRSLIAQLISNIQNNGAVVIAIDFMFSEEESNIIDQTLKELQKKKMLTPTIESTLKKIIPDFDKDKQLAVVLQKSDEVLGFSFLRTPEINGELPQPALQLVTPREKQLHFLYGTGYVGILPILKNAAKNGGFINVYPDDDGIIRRVPLIMRYKDNIYASLAVEAVRLYLFGNISYTTGNYATSSEIENIKINDYTVATDVNGQALIPFRGKSYTFPSYSAAKVLSGKLPNNIFAGKIIFVGTSATGLGDIRATSVEGEFPGVEIQASVADGILKNNFSYRPYWAIGAEITFTFIFGIMIIFLFVNIGPRLLSLMIILIPSVLILANNFLWEKTHLIIHIIVPIMFTMLFAIINIIYGYLVETLRRERLKEMFGQYVPTKHIDAMLKSSDGFGLFGEDRMMTVLFADIRNFTAISEFMSATQLKDMLNQFFTPMTEIIFKYRGTIDKYVGDMIMAFWGAPLKDSRHAHHALEAALEMQVALKKINASFATQGFIKLFFGIGISTGSMSVGDMGSKYRRNYTVLGDAVNLGSRIESLTKLYGINIIVTEATRKEQTNFIFRELDKVQVKGKKACITIYELICKADHLTKEKKQEIHISEQALAYYYHQKWDKAQRLFAKLNKKYPKAKLYILFLDRIAQFKEKPPASDWTGVTNIHS